MEHLQNEVGSTIVTYRDPNRCQPSHTPRDSISSIRPPHVQTEKEYREICGGYHLECASIGRHPPENDLETELRDGRRCH
ncbi:hypothetical protein LSAT2_019544 [Lamellibrachia satsuma]|nr:hypothetical protein LSAT2_019544 [Lamellibrachia satsuma]